MNSPAPAKSAADLQQLDALTGGAFTAATSGERAARVRDWLSSQPLPEQLQAVYKELSIKDKGAAKLLRERLDEIRRAQGQEVMAAEWALKAQALLDAAKINIADAMAWQRDAAKAGAPLSREPLQSLKLRLAECVRQIEELQHQVLVQSEAAVLLTQRIEVLSTKSWRDAREALPGLQSDVEVWHKRADSLQTVTGWSSVDLKFPARLEAARNQLALVWDAFRAVLEQAEAASVDPTAPLPAVPVWAEELRKAHGLPSQAAAVAQAPLDPELQRLAQTAVAQVIEALERELAEGHGKASAGAAALLRQALKEHGKWIGHELDVRAHAVLAAAGELEGWQRWRADQLRTELVQKAEALLNRPAGQALGGRKMQEILRTLREQWKQTDQGGMPNHALWKRFDHACNEAHKVVEVWLDKMRAEAAVVKMQRQALIEELTGWTAQHAGAPVGDWKVVARTLHQFAERWRTAGHLAGKAFADLEGRWKQAMQLAGAPLQQAQKDSVQRRMGMIEEAKSLGAEPMLRIDAVKALQQRWQAEVHVVPLDRRQEQKLWDAFRYPIDQAFQRKTAEREKASQALGARDRQVLDAAKSLEQANASGDVAAIRTAMARLQQVLHEASDLPPGGTTGMPATIPTSVMQALPEETSADPALANPLTMPDEAVAQAGDTPVSLPAATPIRKPVVAVRGDDRPGKQSPARALADPRSAARGAAAGFGADRSRAGPSRRPESGRSAAVTQLPRLGDTAFRAQRDALEHAQATLRKLAMQAHGEALTQLLEAWEKRDPAALPGAQELGAKLSAGMRSRWSAALAAPACPADAGEDKLLRLEIAAEIPSPASELEARRSLQLQLLTRRNAPTPLQTWGEDVAALLASVYDSPRGRRLQQALKVLLRR